MKELEARYSGEWVLLVNPVHNELMEPIRGELVFHNKDRGEVYKEAHTGKTLTRRFFMLVNFLKTWWLCFEIPVDPKAGIILLKTTGLTFRTVEWVE